jgi:hypothetical protein
VRGGRATRGHLGFRRKKGWTGGETSESSTLSATRTSVYVITNLNILLYTHALLLKVVNSRSPTSVRSRGVIAKPRRTPPRRVTATWVKCSICLFLWIRYRSACRKGRDTPFARSPDASDLVSPAIQARRPRARRGPPRLAGPEAPAARDACRLNHTRSDQARTYRRKDQFSDRFGERRAPPAARREGADGGTATTPTCGPQAPPRL